MKPKDQNKYDTFFEEDSTEQEGGEVFEKLLASKKVIQRNNLTVHFSSDLSQLTTNAKEGLSTTSLKTNKKSQKLEAIIKEATTEKPIPSVPKKQDSNPINFEEKIKEIENIPTKSDKIEKDDPKETIQPLVTKQPSFTEIKKMPTFETDKLLDNKKEQSFTPDKKDTSTSETTIPSQEEVIDSEEFVEEMDPIDESTSSYINGGSTAQHVTDSPYVEEPIAMEGKNLIPRSQEVHDILSYVPSWMVRWGNTVILLILGGILVMCYFIKYPDVVNGNITINSTYPPVPLVAKSTGAVTIFKEDKAAVSSDEPIGVIKNTAIYKDVMTLQSVLTDFQEKLDKGWSFSFYELPKGLQLGELQSSYNQLFLKLKEQKVQYQSSKNNTKRKGNINQQIAELKAIKKAKEQSLSIKYQEYLKAKNLLDTRHKILYAKGSISAEQLNAKESEVRNLLDIYQNDRMTFNEIKKRILDLNSNKSELDFQKEDQQILSQSSLIAAYEELKVAIQSWEKKYVLKAPIAGTLNFIRYTKNDMYLQQEQSIANIIPITELEGERIAMVGELIIPSIGSGKTAVGQVVNIELNDYPKKQYGVVLGKIESIDNVTVPIPDGNGMAGYKVLVSFPKGLENTLKKDIQFKHNMQGKGEIITEDIRLIERFFHELRDIVDAN